MGFFDRFKKKTESTNEKIQKEDIKDTSKKTSHIALPPIYLGLKSNINGKKIDETDILKGVGLKPNNPRNENLIDFLCGDENSIFIGGNIGIEDAKKGNDFVVVINPRGMNILDAKRSVSQNRDNPKIKKFNLIENIKYDVAFVKGTYVEDVIGVLDVSKNKFHWNDKYISPNGQGDHSDYDLMIKITIIKPKNDKHLNLLDTLAFIDPIINGYKAKEDTPDVHKKLFEEYKKAIDEYMKLTDIKSLQEINQPLQYYVDATKNSLEALYEQFIKRLGKKNIQLFDRQLLRIKLEGDGKKLKNEKNPNEIKWEPEIPINIKKIIDKSTYYVNKKYTNVVFSNGTIIAITDKNKDPKQEAIKLLTSIMNYHLDFVTRRTDDDNYLVSYNPPAFSIIFKEEYDKHREYLMKNVHKALPWHEVLIPPRGSVVDTTVAGLLGRVRLWQDFVQQKIVNIHKGSYE